MGFDLTLTLWVLIGGAMILFMHGGFCMLEAGFILGPKQLVRLS